MKTKITTYVPPLSDETSEKFINYIMEGGKKTIARTIFNDMLGEIEKRGHKEPRELFFRAIKTLNLPWKYVQNVSEERCTKCHLK